MLHSKEPDLLNYSRYLDNFSDKRRAPACTISFNEKVKPIGKTAAQHLGPGQYKRDVDFVDDKFQQVRKGGLTGSASAPRFSFGHDSRVDLPTGVMKGVIRPANNWINPLGPGQYNRIDGTERHNRVMWPSSQAWTVPKGESAQSIREKKGTGISPGPGVYDLPSFFDDVGRQRQEAMEKSRRRGHSCHWENQFGTIFRSIHASATQKRGVIHAKIAAKPSSP
mmetsp:Transcript_48819/g.79251  ORF Transcript_48819/g.79251 Transcript_48819/m.79251 type:complete len:223 (-) Transcript_48819:139-807(-)